MDSRPPMPSRKEYRQPTKRENEKFSPMCKVHGKTPSECRTLISEGRKVGFVLDYGTIPSKLCFQHAAPTQSWSKANVRPTGPITLIPNGWKVALDVRGTLYLGEVQYTAEWVPMYRFSRFEMATIIDSSKWFDAPTPAFIEILSRLPDTGPSDERPNGKLYMGCQYSEPQQAMREEFSRHRPAVPPDAEDLFNRWAQTPTGTTNAPGSRSLGTSSKESFVEEDFPMEAPRVAPVRTKHTSASDTSRAEPPPSPMVRFKSEHSRGSSKATVSNQFSKHHSAAASSPSGFFASSSLSTTPPHIAAPTSFARLDLNSEQPTPPRSDRKRPSADSFPSNSESAYGGYESDSSLRLQKKRQSDNLMDSSTGRGSFQFTNETEYQATFGVIQEVVHEAHQVISAHPRSKIEGTSLLVDPFIASISHHHHAPSHPRRGSLDVEDDVMNTYDDDASLKDVVKMLRADSMDFLGEDMLSDNEPDNRRMTLNMTATDLFNVLKHPDSETLTRAQMKRAISTLLQMPIPSHLLNATFDACDTDKTGRVTLENFIHMMEARERQLRIEFRSIDTDGSGEITLDELRAAKSKGIFTAQEHELDALLTAMDRISLGDNHEYANDRKIQWSEFRAMMILLPPATTIQTIVDLVKVHLDETEQLKDVLVLGGDEPGRTWKHANSVTEDRQQDDAAMDAMEQAFSSPFMMGVRRAASPGKMALQLNSPQHYAQNSAHQYQQNNHPHTHAQLHSQQSLHEVNSHHLARFRESTLDGTGQGYGTRVGAEYHYSRTTNSGISSPPFFPIPATFARTLSDQNHFGQADGSSRFVFGSPPAGPSWISAIADEPQKQYLSDSRFISQLPSSLRRGTSESEWAAVVNSTSALSMEDLLSGDDEFSIEL